MRTASEVLARAHLAKAEEYWLSDQLGKAHAAMTLALNEGIPPNDVFDRQRTIDAELAARNAGDLVRLDEHLITEAPGELDRRKRSRLLTTIRNAMTEVTRLWDVHWGKPVMVTVFASRQAALFMHSRYGYYAERRETHKICLPIEVSRAEGSLRLAALHEIAHAAVYDIAGPNVRAWLNEGIAVWTEGGSSMSESGRLRAASLFGQVPTLDQMDAVFGNYAVALDSGEADRAYTAAGSFVAYLVETLGLDAVQRLLRAIREQGDTPRTFRRALGLDQRQAEREWLTALTAESAT